MGQWCLQVLSILGEKDLMEIREVLEQRGSVHGPFRDQATMAQNLKFVARMANWNALEPWKREAIDMVLHKLSRALIGNSDFEDHWVDIIGYTQLVLDEIKHAKESKETTVDSPAEGNGVPESSGTGGVADTTDTSSSGDNDRSA